ncbi:hypothetical protein UPYG_G00029490 [Umbra pygmaea]|uniref:Caspase-1 n=1 Tax=Umbra pygmaea TaxID=75934 RepID=A0ABD0XMG5_UMBPY
MADKVLNKARTLFIDSVSKQVINQLLDDLFEEKVLNEEEKDSVKEEKNTRAEQARYLIDMVRKKGSTASQKMIDHIKNRDPGLYEKLGLAPKDPAPTPSLPQPLSPPLSQEERPLSRVLIHSTADFKANKIRRKSREIYQTMEKSGRMRLALLINNVEFDDIKMRRTGAEKDEENIEKLLKDLGYDVVKHKNLSGLEIDQAVKAFSERKEHLSSDSVFVVLMSHGELGGILGVHYKEGEPSPDVFPINNIFTHLNTENCKALMNKPKVILIQACRGGKDGSVWVSDAVPATDPDRGLESDSIKREHKEKDFISLLSCTPDTVSYRHKETGSFFIQRIIETFNTYACEDHVEELFRKVMSRFGDFPRQMPSKDRVTLTKEFYLFPGL